MKNKLFPTNRQWLWLLLGMWLIALQFAALSHSTEHSLDHEHNHCLLCNFAHTPNAGPSSVHIPPLIQQQQEDIVAPLYLQPSLPWPRGLNARAPPFLS